MWPKREDDGDLRRDAIDEYEQDVDIDIGREPPPVWLIWLVALAAVGIGYWLWRSAHG